MASHAGMTSTSVAPVDGSVPRRPGTRLTVTLPLLAVSCGAAVWLILAGVPVSPRNALPWIALLTLALGALRVFCAIHAGNELHRRGCFFVNLGLAAGAILLSPTFGLYLFISFHEASLFTSRLWRVVGIVATALVVAVAQTGGPRSEIFTFPIYVAFATITLVVALIMAGLDAERERLMRRLEQANSDLRVEQERNVELTDQLIEQAREAGVADERKRVSREIHDTVAQDLVAIIAQLDAVADETDDAERDRRLALVDATARDALGEARRAVSALASPRLDASDLPLALDDLFGEWRAANELEGVFSVTGDPVTTPHDEHLVRMAQEALANVAKHAHARTVRLHLDYAADGVSLQVTDDGCGFDARQLDSPRPASGYGLPGLRDRLAAVGGRLDIDSEKGWGTSVTASVPRGATEGAPS
ncbi:sensor histidine kinase [Propioniferax innocua]|uniref:Signal transduction histidine kinase n=1 Tax=Propioniferax innocua TaxID=1753 RepID=A0A542ZPQ5_9ACTN|nr:sensor histidine kinase [Propioniferax innocua]TQL62338.1 signal transduction histidine kinase [Propioniferax innocua]